MGEPWGRRRIGREGIKWRSGRRKRGEGKRGGVKWEKRGSFAKVSAYGAHRPAGQWQEPRGDRSPIYIYIYIYIYKVNLLLLLLLLLLIIVCARQRNISRSDKSHSVRTRPCTSARWSSESVRLAPPSTSQHLPRHNIDAFWLIALHRRERPKFCRLMLSFGYCWTATIYD